jgi:aminopeptidase N
MSSESKIDLSKVFDQYLRTTQIPVLEYKVEGNRFSYRYTNCVSGFNMPLKVKFKTEQWINPTEDWKSLDLFPDAEYPLTVDPNFYIKTKKTE